MFERDNNCHKLMFALNPEIRSFMAGNSRRSRKQQLMRGNNVVATEKDYLMFVKTYIREKKVVE